MLTGAVECLGGGHGKGRSRYLPGGLDQAKCILSCLGQWLGHLHQSNNNCVIISRLYNTLIHTLVKAHDKAAWSRLLTCSSFPNTHTLVPGCFPIKVAAFLIGIPCCWLLRCRMKPANWKSFIAIIVVRSTAKLKLKRNESLLLRKN